MKFSIGQRVLIRELDVYQREEQTDISADYWRKFIGSIGTVIATDEGEGGVALYDVRVTPANTVVCLESELESAEEEP